MEPPAPPFPPVEYTVTGSVEDAAYRFIPGARIEVVEGARVGVSTMTDASGRFMLPGTFTGEIAVRVEKAGYVSAMQRERQSFGGQLYLYFNRELDGPSLNLTGDWNLTLRADGSCAGVPDGLRTRTYTTHTGPPQTTILPMDSSRPVPSMRRSGHASG
jgi:hypothetical protein